MKKHLYEVNNRLRLFERQYKPSIWRRVFTRCRQPDLIINDGYLLRWFVIPRNRFLNIYLHCFIGSDEPLLHDHPWWSVSLLLKGKLKEVVSLSQDNRGKMVATDLRRFVPKIRSAKYAHRIVLEENLGSSWLLYKEGAAHLLPSHRAWTLFITGPIIRRWGFWTNKGWVDFRKYLHGDNKND